LFGDGGLAKGANDGLSSDLLQVSPTATANLSAAVRVDTGFWHDNVGKLRQRFDTWLAAH
jgi:putative spermidine/putrescine transport system substrate-binding protein